MMRFLIVEGRKPPRLRQMLQNSPSSACLIGKHNIFVVLLIGTAESLSHSYDQVNDYSFNTVLQIYRI